MEGDGLTNEQTEKVLQLQDLTGIEDINICRDVLIRHEWDLEVAVQEQLNIREGRPSMYATNDNRAPQVINDRFLQHIFTNNRPDNTPGGGLTAMVRYFVNYIFNFCYSTLTTIVTTVVSLFRNSERSKFIFVGFSSSAKRFIYSLSLQL